MNSNSMFYYSFPFSNKGMPALIVVVSLAATQADGYGTEFVCWLSVESKLIWAFVGPALFIIVVRFL